MKYVIQNKTSDGVSYFFRIAKSCEPQFTTRMKYAKVFKNEEFAERMLKKIKTFDVTLNAEILCVANELKCTFDCFHCPFADCVNDTRVRTPWEKKALSSALGIYDR